MNNNEDIKALIDKLSWLDTRIGEIEGRQKDMERVSKMAEGNIKEAKTALFEAKMLVNNICRNGLIASHGTSEPTHTHHYTSEDPVHKTEPAPILEQHNTGNEVVPAKASTQQAPNKQISHTLTAQQKEPVNSVPHPAIAKNTVKPERKQIDWEKLIGQNTMGILASVLIFISLGIFGALVFPILGNEIRFALMTAFSAAIAIAGGIKTKKNRNAFSLSLMACGIGGMYITLLCGRLIFGLYGDLMLFNLILLWATGTHYLYRRYGSTVFPVIGHLGIMSGVMLACRNIADTYGSGITTTTVFNEAMKTFIAVTVFLLLSEVVLYGSRIRNIADLCFKTASTGISLMAMMATCSDIGVRSYLQNTKAEFIQGLTGPVASIDPAPMYYVFIGIVLLILIYNVLTDLIWGYRNNILISQIFGLINVGIMHMTYTMSPEMGTGLYLVLGEFVLLGVFIWLYKKAETGAGSKGLNTIYLIAVMFYPSFIPMQLFFPFKYTGIFWFAVTVLVITLRTGWLKNKEITALSASGIFYGLVPVNVSRITENLSETRTVPVMAVALITWVSGMIFTALISKYSSDNRNEHPHMACLSLFQASSMVISTMTALGTGFGHYPQSLKLDTRIYLTLFMTGIMIVLAIYRHIFREREGAFDKIHGICTISMSVLGLIFVLAFNVRREQLISNKTGLEYLPQWTAPEWLNCKTCVYVLFAILVIAVSVLFFMATTWLKRHMDRTGYGIMSGISYSVLWIAVSDKTNIPYLMSVGLILWAVICIATGFKIKLKSIRFYGLILSIISVGKLVMMDIQYDNSIARAASMAVCGVLLFIISFSYNKAEKGQDGE